MAEDKDDEKKENRIEREIQEPLDKLTQQTNEYLDATKAPRKETLHVSLETKKQTQSNGHGQSPGKGGR